MKTLKTLTFTAPPSEQQNPVALRRVKLVARLEQQKLLAENPLHVRVVQRWIRQDNGEKALVEIPKRLQPWWRTDETGTTYKIEPWQDGERPGETGKMDPTLFPQSSALTN